MVPPNGRYSAAVHILLILPPSTLRPSTFLSDLSTNPLRFSFLISQLSHNSYTILYFFLSSLHFLVFSTSSCLLYIFLSSLLLTVFSTFSSSLLYSLSLINPSSVSSPSSMSMSGTSPWSSKHSALLFRPYDITTGSSCPYDRSATTLAT